MDYFSPNYNTARERFYQAVKAAGLSVEPKMHPLLGPEQESLSTDVVTFGDPNAPNHLLLCSATHGVEGFCGSACQLQWLTNAAANPLPKSVAVTLIHAINPFGFAWLRRVNEDNIDLNRNFIHFDQSPPENALYKELLPAILPKTLHPDDLAKAKENMRRFVTDHGSEQMQRTLSQGQYQFPEGLYFGGAQPSWSNKQFRLIVQERLAQAKRAIFIDFHTGLGPFGVGELITEYAPESVEYQWTKQIYQDATSTVGGDSSSVKLSGTIDFAFHESLPSGCQGSALALEFGTRKSSQVFNALRNDNWLHVVGNNPATATPAHIDQQARSAKIKAELLDAFFPNEEGWKNAVLARSTAVTETAISFLSQSRT